MTGILSSEVEMEEETTAGVVFGQRLTQVRTKRGITKAALSRRLDELGHPLHRVVLGEIEAGGTRARNVSLEDVLAIAYALGVPPLQMMFPYDDETRVRIVSNRPPVEPDQLRLWIWGAHGGNIEEADEVTYMLELPEKELVRLASGAKVRALTAAIMESGVLDDQPA